MPTLEELEAELRLTGKFWRYASRVEGRPLSNVAKVEIAQAVLSSGKSWAEGLAAEFAARQYPPDFDEDGDE